MSQILNTQPYAQTGAEATARSSTLPSPAQQPAKAISGHAVRRGNLHTLLQEFSRQQLADGFPAKGLETAFACKLQVSPSMLSQIKSSRNISDALAQQIERICQRPHGWLSAQHDDTQDAKSSEEDFLALARQAWRQATPQEREQLHTQLAATLPPKKPDTAA